MTYAEPPRAAGVGLRPRAVGRRALLKGSLPLSAAGVTGTPAAALAEAVTKGPGDATGKLFPGERVIEAGGFPSLVKFIKGQPDRPLVVFIPGTSFLARIAYGFPGGREADFLAYWLVRNGYSFLGTSYPLENSVFANVYPKFGITDWGRQIVATANQAITENGLSRSMIAIGWSMGGRTVETVARAARDAGLDLRLFVALDALPPGPNLFAGNPEQLRLKPNGMVDQISLLMPWFEQMVEVENRMNGHTIIPPGIFGPAFTGDPPLGIQGETAQFMDARMVMDVGAAAADSGATDYRNYPPMGLIISDSPADYPNVLLCRTNWGLAVGQQLYRRHVFPVRDRMARLSQAKWRALQDMFKAAMDRLTVQISGTHFLFVGERGASQTAAAVTRIAAAVETLNSEIAAQLR